MIRLPRNSSESKIIYKETRLINPDLYVQSRKNVETNSFLHISASMEKATCTLSDMDVSCKMALPLMTSQSLQQDGVLFNLSRKTYIRNFYVGVAVKTTEM